MVLLCSLIFLAFQTVATSPGEVAAQGRSWEQFLQSIREQRDLWLKTEARVSVAPELVARVERAGRGLQLIVVAEDWCPDSAYTVPYVARLATLAGVPLRVVDSEPPQPDADNARRRKESSRRRRNVEPIGADPIRPAATAGAASLSGSRYVGVSKRLLLGG